MKTSRFVLLCCSWAVLVVAAPACQPSAERLARLEAVQQQQAGELAALRQELADKEEEVAQLETCVDELESVVYEEDSTAYEDDSAPRSTQL